MQIGTTCQRYNIGKVYVSSILPSTRSFFNIGQINEIIKELCHKKNFVFIYHQTIASNGIWVDGIEKFIESYINQIFFREGRRIFISEF